MQKQEIAGETRREQTHQTQETACEARRGQSCGCPHLCEHLLGNCSATEINPDIALFVWLVVLFCFVLFCSRQGFSV